MSLTKRLKYFRIRNIKYIFHLHYWANEELRVPVSRHYFLSTFGVKQRHDAGAAESGEFVCTGVPGTGFFVHSSDSHSYHEFVRQARRDYSASFGNKLARREPSYERELKRVSAALNTEQDAHRKRILDAYRNSLTIGQQAQMLQRLERGVKDKVGHHLGKDALSVVTHIKGQVASLQHDMKAAQMKPLETLSAAQQAAWLKVQAAFKEFMQCRRIFWIEEDPTTHEQNYTQVFADNGIFDFIWMPGDTPVLRDGKGGTYYLYPAAIIKAKSSTDFEILDMSHASVQFQPVEVNELMPNSNTFDINNLKRRKHSGNTLHDALSNLYGVSRQGQMAYLVIPQLGLRLLCSNADYAKHMVDAIAGMLKTE